MKGRLMMHLKKLRDDYETLGGDKKDYLNSVMSELSILGNIRDFICDTDINMLQIEENDIVAEFKSVPIKMFFDVEDAASPITQSLCFGNVEGDYSRKLIECMCRSNVVFDIGANVGYYSIACAKSNSSAKICSFEPIPQTYMKLIRNIVLNSCTNVSPYNFGFLDEQKRIEMFFDKTSSGAASLQNILGTTKNLEECSFMELDLFVEKYNLVPDCMKIDVEGSELFVLKGASKTLQKHNPIIFVEILRKWCKVFGHSAVDVFDTLHSFGYHGHVVRGDGFERIEMIDDSTVDTNFVFIKQ